MKYTQAHLPLFESLSVSTDKFHSSSFGFFCVCSVFCSYLLRVCCSFFGAVFMYMYDCKFIAGVPSSWVLDGHPVTAHYSYAFLNFRES